jgi:hypothetical protein
MAASVAVCCISGTRTRMDTEASTFGDVIAYVAANCTKEASSMSARHWQAAQGCTSKTPHKTLHCHKQS